MVRMQTMTAGETQQEAWRDDEKKLRIREVEAQEGTVRVQRRTFWSQVAVAIAAILASLAAVFAAGQARSAVNVAEQGVQEQDAENQLSTAVTALGGPTEAQRVAGVTLLERNVADQLATLTNEQSRWNAYSLYLSAVTVLANYLQSGAPPAADGPCPNVGEDVKYAADELKTLLDMRQQVMGLEEGRIAIDLSRSELCAQYWKGISFSWLSAAYLWKIDLRGSNLQDSHWGTAYLADAQLQCADLSGADLSQANLAGADLRGANLVGASLPKTLQRAQLAGAITVPTNGWDSGSCLENRAYWDPWNASAAAASARKG
jgi:hypothetical protein